jgi:hypothetical protein
MEDNMQVTVGCLAWLMAQTGKKKMKFQKVLILISNLFV